MVAMDQLSEGSGHGPHASWLFLELRFGVVVGVCTVLGIGRV